MTEVVSVKFKSCGKSYFFSPNGLAVPAGEKVIVETAKGLEFAECARTNHFVEDTSVVQPLRAVVRIATPQDKRSMEANAAREKEAFTICQEKILKHGLDMKLVDVECSFEGNKTTFFFTSDGRVDFRELVKDLAGIFHNRIELRQIGVRDEAKMIGGIGICGRPYCCSQFLDDFAPVSTKMAKVQSLSLNPAKISGSCGRLMCCLRYEEEAYEDLTSRVPKQGAFVETADGYGMVVQVNLLRQTVKVSLDGESGETLHLYRADEVAAVPGGRPRDGEKPAHVYVPVEREEEPEEEPVNEWEPPAIFVKEPETEPAPAEKQSGEKPQRGRHRRQGRGRKELEQGSEARAAEPRHAEKQEAKEKTREENIFRGEEKPADGDGRKFSSRNRRRRRGPKVESGTAGNNESAPKEDSIKPAPEKKSTKPAQKPKQPAQASPAVKPVKKEKKPAGEKAAPAVKPDSEEKIASKRRYYGHRRGGYRGKPKDGNQSKENGGN